MHLKPATGQPRPVGSAIVDYLFPAKADDHTSGRIPLVGITGSAGDGNIAGDTTLAAQILDHILRLTDQATGLACAQGVFLGTLPVATQSLSPAAAAQTLLINRQTEIVVIENSIETMLNEGLAYDRCQVGIVTALDAADVLPAYHIDTPERLFNVVRTQVDVVLPNGVAVLNADCPLVRDMAELCDGEVILFAAGTADDVASAEAIAAHRAKNGRAVLMHAGMILLVTGDQTQPLLALADLSSLAMKEKVGAGNTPHSLESVSVKLPWGTSANQNLTPLLAAIGAAWALNVPLATLRTGIETF